MLIIVVTVVSMVVTEYVAQLGSFLFVFMVINVLKYQQ